mgnify:FL=1
MKTVMQDTADVIITDLITGKVVMNAEAQIGTISGTTEEEDLFGGIGNKKLYKIRSQKNVELTMSSAYADIEYWAMQQGVQVDEAGTATVTKSAFLKIADNAGALEVTIPNAPAGLVEAILVDKDGSQDPVTVTTGVVEVPVGAVAKAGDEIQVFYQETVTGNTVVIDAAKFSNKVKIEYRTISYDPVTAAVHADVYFLFDEAIPSGNFEIGLSNGQAYAPEVTFSVVAPKGSDELGRIVEVTR